MKAQPPVLLCVIGAECTGKTTLARDLAAALGVPWVAEPARLFVERHGPELSLATVDPIARLTIEMHDAAIAEATRAGQRALVLDGDLISTCVYAQHYYGQCPAWVREEALRRRAGLYLLTEDLLPWEDEPGQRSTPAGRAQQIDAFRRALALEFEAPRLTPTGPPEARVEQTLKFLRHGPAIFP